MTRHHTLLCLLAAASACLAVADDSYVDSITRHRSAIDAEFRDPETSPIPDTELAGFSGLRYFDIDPNQRVAARFQPAADTSTFRMSTFNDEFIDFSTYGYLVYQSPSGEEVHLTLFQREDIGEMGKRFALLAFRDLTNGESTYSGGRYIELDAPLSDPPIIDFNLASNPLCAYDPKFACPIPPKENWLNFAVQAGEKAYH